MAYDMLKMKLSRYLNPFVVWSIVFPENVNAVDNAVFAWTTGSWGWLYRWTAFPMMFLPLLVMFGTLRGLNRLTAGGTENR